ncbi:sulfotransferase 1C4-like [Liolophura sinensis]|uniref:sulfotransferase 1C4-like n=1 Tax=Liolophura sinensis TaxID=3198878 RepID=UPI003158EBE8
MPPVQLADQSGHLIHLYEFNGKYYPAFPGIGQILKELPNLPARNDDVMILTYPKAGTHWTWEISNMLYTGDGQISTRYKDQSMLEAVTGDSLAALPSVRLLNTHLPPEFYPKDLIKRKCKVIFVQRNPKDIFVSFFHHTTKIKLYSYQGDWNGYFELLMNGKNDYGTWFQWTKQYERFFAENPQIPVLRLYFEEMKQDLPREVEKMAKFLDVSCEPSYRDKVAEKCRFHIMKKERMQPQKNLNVPLDGNDHPIFRKGMVGDWKSHFTVAQNERFDEEYNKEMKDYSFKFEGYM